MAKKGDKTSKSSSVNAATTNVNIPQSVTAIKQEKVDDEELKASIYPVDASSSSSSTLNYMDGLNSKSGNSSGSGSHNSSFNDPSQMKPSIEDYYQSYHPYQYQYGSNYFHHQNSRFYQDKNYFYGHMMGSEQNRGMFSPTNNSAAITTPTQASNSVQNLQNHQQNGFYHAQQSTNYATNSASTPATASDPNYLFNFNNTININTSNLMININNSSNNNLTNNSSNNYHHLQH
jgi:hypothetical protein